MNDSSNEEYKFVTKKWHVIDCQTGKGKYNQNNSIKLKRQKVLNQTFEIILIHLF